MTKIRSVDLDFFKKCYTFSPKSSVHKAYEKDDVKMKHDQNHIVFTIWAIRVLPMIYLAYQVQSHNPQFVDPSTLILRLAVKNVFEFNKIVYLYTEPTSCRRITLSIFYLLRYGWPQTNCRLALSRGQLVELYYTNCNQSGRR